MPSVFSVAYRPTWAADVGGSILCFNELETETYEGISLPLEHLMMMLEIMLPGEGFEYFHPTQFELIAKHLDSGLCVIFTTVYREDNKISLEMKLASAIFDGFDKLVMDVSARLDMMIQKMGSSEGRGFFGA
jgi:hypothetical protein